MDSLITGIHGLFLSSEIFCRDCDIGDSDADDSNADASNKDSDTETPDINDGDSNIGDGVDASDSGDGDVEDTNPWTDDVADSEKEGTDAVLGSQASFPAATDCKKHLLSLVCDPCSKFGPETETYEAKDIICIQK